MYEGVIEGLMGIITWKAMMLMVVGVAIASFFAAAPGIGGLLLLSLLMPYAITLHPYEFIALIIGAATVGNTANTFTSVLVGVPGGSGAQATVLDGYPMAKKGEANRAFGAAFLGSAVGAVIGAATFILTLPIFTPLVLSLGSPEFLMLVLWGLSAVSVLGGKAPAKGLACAVIGLSIALIGTDTRTGIERFTFGTAYLESPLSVVIIAMGIFAMPEMFELMVKRTRIAEVESLGSGLVEGMKDVFRHWWLVVRSSMVGVWVGILPGLGSS
ncbi:MAG: tripartite tricarboxylate transporter permease, partial [Alphaproteobacteria bacterium]